MTAPAEAAPQTGEDRARQVRRIFTEIAPRYDLLNHLLSLNVDRRWRRRAVERLGWQRAPDGRYLDACSGTFDLALELSDQKGFRGRTVASDFARRMLVEGRGKVGVRAVDAVCGDSLRLPFPDRTFDGATVGFGVRNLADLDRGLRELYRVLKPGARLVLLEFTLPPNRFVRSLYMFYFDRVLPVVGRVVSGHPWAYTYLPESVKDFPGPDDLARRMAAAGFRDPGYELLTFGVAALHSGLRPQSRPAPEA